MLVLKIFFYNIFVGHLLYSGKRSIFVTIYKNKNVILLEGNHEKWLRIYASKDYDISNYKGNNHFKYKDIYIT